MAWGRRIGEALRWLWERRWELAPVVSAWCVVGWSFSAGLSAGARAAVGAALLVLVAWSLTTHRQVVKQRTGPLGWAFGVVLTADALGALVDGSGAWLTGVGLAGFAGGLAGWWALRSAIDETAVGYRRRLRSRRAVRHAQRALDRACWATRSVELRDPPLVRSVTVDSWGESWALSLRAGATVAVLNSVVRSLESAWHRPVGSVSVRSDPSCASRVVLRLASADPLAAAPGPGPWGRDGFVPSARRAVPVGVDSAGREVTLDLSESHHFAVATTRHGKTHWLRELAAWWTLAEDCDQPLIVTLKRSGDWDPFRVAGVPIVDDLTDACRVLDAAFRDMQKRGAELAAQGVSSVRSDARFRYRPIVIDEVHHLFLAGDDEVPRELLRRARRAVTMIASQGASAGVILAVATQRPNVDFLPGSVAANLGTRWVGRTVSTRAGQDALGVPVDADPSRLSQEHRGRAFVTDGTGFREVRTWTVDDVLLARLFRAARQPSETVDPGEVDGADRAVLDALGSGVATPSEIGARSGLAVSTVQRALARLEATGMVVDLDPSRRRSKRYRLAHQMTTTGAR